MKSGRSLQSLAAELDRQNDAKRDFVLDTRACQVFASKEETPDGVKENGITMGMNRIEGLFPVNRIANTQIGSRLEIPKKYYDKMMSNSTDLLVHNINHWLQNTPEKRMIRTLDGDCRAFLSDRYRPLDNYDLANAVLPEMIDHNLDIRSCEITESKMYIKAVSHELEGEVKAGDVVRGGCVVSNSEVGLGVLLVSPFIERLVCTNGMVVTDFGKRRYHVGKKNNEVLDINDAYEVYSDATKELTDQAFWHQVRDVVKATLTQNRFETILDSFREATQIPMNEDPMTVVEKTQKKFHLSDGDKGGILQHLLEDKDYTKWGLANAVTRTAEDSNDYDRATELETLGWNVVQMPKRDWLAIGGAA